MKAQPNILLTGATGFVGQAVLERMIKYYPNTITLALRSAIRFDCCATHVVGDFSNATDWSAALSDQQVVIHAAARAHVMKDALADPLAEYRLVNVEATLNLARQAAVAGVRRFIFISSIKVNGEKTPLGKAFTTDDLSPSSDAYAISKREAEQGLRELVADSEMELVIIRPPLVFGPGGKSNFKSLLALTDMRIPLPFGSINNSRSMVALDNLVDLIITCVHHPNAANQTFLVSDDQDLSTTELLTKLGEAAGKPARLIPVPERLLKMVAKLLGKQAVADRLLGNLQVDITHTKETLNWTPPITVEEGLRRCFEPTNKD